MAEATEVDRIREQYGPEAEAALRRAFIAGVNLGARILEAGVIAGELQVRHGAMIAAMSFTEGVNQRNAT